MSVMRTLLDLSKRIRASICRSTTKLRTIPRRHPKALWVSVSALTIGGIVATRHYWRPVLARASSRVGNYVLQFVPNHSHLARILHVVLDVVPDAVPLILALAGLGYCMPRLIKSIEESRSLRITLMCTFLVCGVVAILVNAVNREDQEHEKDHQEERFGALGTSVDQILKFLVSKSSVAPTEAERRYLIEKALRDDFIRSHDPIDPEILAGTKMPPETWMNQRLAQLGEKWKIADAPKAPLSGTPLALGEPSLPHDFLLDEADQQLYVCQSFLRHSERRKNAPYGAGGPIEEDRSKMLHFDPSGLPPGAADRIRNGYQSSIDRMEASFSSREMAIWDKTYGQGFDSTLMKLLEATSNDYTDFFTQHPTNLKNLASMCKYYSFLIPKYRDQLIKEGQLTTPDKAR